MFKITGLMSIHQGLIKGLNMMKTAVLVLCSLLFILLCIQPITTAGECTYGSVYAWYKTTDKGWMNATGHPRFTPGDFFEIKIIITIKTDLQVFYVKLHEFGTPVYEVIKGPTTMEQLLEYRQHPLINQNFTYQWKLRIRPQTSWVNGYAPLEIYAQFNTNDTDESHVCFDVITAYIIDTYQEIHTNTTINDTVNPDNETCRSSPDFSLLNVVGVLFFLFLYIKIKK
jgi:sarcinarray family protein